MPIASSSGRRVAFVPEVTPGTTPATPTFQTIRITGGEGLRATKQTAASDEIRADRNVTDAFLLGVDVAGSYGFELSYGSFDDLIAGALSGAWATNVLKNGILQPYFTFEETLEMGATDTFQRFPMARVNTLALDISSRQKITGTLGLMARQEDLATTAITGATYPAASATGVMTASASVAALTVSGIAPAPKVRRLSLNISNGLRTRPLVGNLYTEEFGEGRVEVTGSLECYFESNTLYQRVKDHGSAAISATIGQVANQKYTLLIPKAQFLDGAIGKGGNNDDVTVTIPFQGLFDAATAASIQITRAVA